MMVVTSEHREVQHTTVLRHLYKNNTFHPIPTSSYVLAFISNNKGTLNPPVSQSAFFKDLSLSLAHLHRYKCSALIYGKTHQFRELSTLSFAVITSDNEFLSTASCE
jgi:hypothetical protein